MPNGESRNWIRCIGAIEGFRVRHGKWPSRVRVSRFLWQELQERLTAKEWAILNSKIDLVPDGSPMIAEDDSGNSYSYGKEGFSKMKPEIRAEEWLGVYPQYED